MFTYGTLLSERVLKTLLGRVPERESAKLYGYSRCPIQDQCYPAVIPADRTSIVRGKILLGVTAEELVLLDEFEDSAYDRLVVSAEKDDGTFVQVRLWSRPVNNRDDLLLEQDWNEEHFRKFYEDWYVERCMDWASWYHDQQKKNGMKR